MHWESTFSDLYANDAGPNEDDSFVSDSDWKYTDKAKREEDVKILADDMGIDKDELDNTNDMDEDDNLLLNEDLANEETQVNLFGDYQYENQQNILKLMQMMSKITLMSMMMKVLTMMWKGTKPLRITT